MKNKYFPTVLSLYINYFVHGMGVIILSQNMDALATKWSTNSAGVAWVISALGIGRLIVLLVSGKLSDKFGRKPFVILGMITYLAYFVGILLSPNIQIAFVFGILAGIANSFLDAGTYPALMESYPKAKGTMNVLIKAFISGGQFLLPLIVAFIVSNNMWYGYSFILCIVILVINGIFIAKVPFPPHTAEEAAKEGLEASVIEFKKQPKWYIDGIVFVVYGYISQATFYLVSQWLTKYGLSVVQMGELASRSLMSYYSVGSLACVFISSFLQQKGVKPRALIVVYTFISMITLGAVYLFPSPTVTSIGAFAIGFSAAGGVMQLGLTLMSEIYPYGKGTVTGIFYTSGSIASFTIPVITGIMSTTSIASIMGFDAVIAVIGFVCGIIIAIRHKQIVKEATR
ncbi:MFS transporter [Calorimonas adulescens]|uniref:MFS transporter n=1 Tax=Calorimonas adulescens TaxID=2606906 RepID=A0A5D8QAE0_9THEO|nr:MFS transporter [Calorimonas adulescens]TZE81104.1 MFS transporter [Calorimonas adulescens]